MFGKRNKLEDREILIVGRKPTDVRQSRPEVSDCIRCRRIEGIDIQPKVPGGIKIAPAHTGTDFNPRHAIRSVGSAEYGQRRSAINRNWRTGGVASDSCDLPPTN